MTTCIVCRKVIPSGPRCEAHKLPVRRNPTPARKARSTQAWTERSKQVRSLGFCIDCRKPFPPSELEAHHEIMVSDRPDLVTSSPVVPLCREHHRARHITAT